ncbi:MAG: nucleotidyltransferase domain-containing protein [archaeon]
MEFKIDKKKNPNLGKYESNSVDIAYKFAKEAYKEVGQFLKAIVLFGSTARKKQEKSDVDILLIIDDVSIILSPEFVQTYRVIVEKIIGKTSDRLHVTSLRLTNFWEYIRAGDPIAINILRDGVPLIDTGFFEPLQVLLYQGRIRPTPEAVWTYFNRAPRTLENAKWHVTQAVLDLYWAVIDASHAALMKINEVPPSPEHVADLLDEKMVKRGLLKKKYPEVMRKFYLLSRQVLHHELKSISGKMFDEYLTEADEFVRVLREFIEKH